MPPLSEIDRNAKIISIANEKAKNRADKKRLHDSIEDDENNNKPKSKKATQSKKAKTEDEDKYDVRDIHLEGEESGRVPVFDTCADIRRKISAHARKGVTTKKAMLEAFQASAQQYKTFMKGTKSMQGAEKDIFYGAYVYFEKLRIKQGGKKSKKRQEMERIWGPNGVERTQTDRIFACKGEHLFFNQYGQLEVNGVVVD